MSKPKQNRCLPYFLCESDNCSHYAQGENDFCKYRQRGKCTSKAAQNNAMFVSLEKQGIIQKSEGQDLSSCECQSWARTDMTFADLGTLQDHHPNCKHRESE